MFADYPLCTKRCPKDDAGTYRVVTDSCFQDKQEGGRPLPEDSLKDSAVGEIAGKLQLCLN